MPGHNKQWPTMKSLAPAQPIYAMACSLAFRLAGWFLFSFLPFSSLLVAACFDLARLLGLI